MRYNKRFDDKILAQKNAWLWAWFDVPGGVWLTFFSGSLLAMWWMTFLYNRHVSAAERLEIPVAITTTYSVIVTAFAASNIARWYRERQCGPSNSAPQPPSSD